MCLFKLLRFFSVIKNDTLELPTFRSLNVFEVQNLDGKFWYKFHMNLAIQQV